MAKSNIASFICGILFSIGLGISGMTQPQKVIGFLDVFGEWDLSLAFVMGGAVLSYLILQLWIQRNFSIPVLEDPSKFPPARILIDHLLLERCCSDPAGGLGVTVPALRLLL